MRRRLSPRLILALDVDTLKRAGQLVAKLYPKIKIFKVGARLFTAYGPQAIKIVRKQGADVFLDLKYFDIPNTVAGAVEAAVRQKAAMLTLHIAAGVDAIKAARKSADKEARRLKTRPALLIGVTVLTSEETEPGRVLTLARRGIAAGLDGVVCSSREAAMLRKELKRDFVIVTPGIRPENYPAHDQRRTATVISAVKAGSDFLVVGRPILEAKNPRVQAERMLEEIESHERRH